MADVKQFIIEARNQGIPDNEIYDFLNQKGMLQSALEETQKEDIMQEGQKAQEFLRKPLLGQVISPQFAREIPGAAAQTLLKQPAKFLASAAEVPETLATGKATQRTYKAPLVGEFKSFQSEAETRAGRIIDDKDPLYTALAPFAEVPLAASELTFLANLGAKGLRGVSRLVKSTGEAVAKSAYDLSAREAGLVQAYKAKVPFLTRVKLAMQGKPSPLKPTTVGETAMQVRAGTQTGIGIRARRASSRIWNEVIQPELDRAGGTISMPQFFADLKAKVIKQTSELGRRKDLLEAVDAMADDYKGISVPYAQLQKYKEAWTKFLPEKVWRGKPIAGAFNEVKDMAGDIAREMIHAKLGPTIKQAYQDYGNLKGVMEVGQKAMTEGKLKGGFGSMIHELYDIAVHPVKTIGGKAVIYRVGQFGEFVGKAGAKTLGELFRGL